MMIVINVYHGGEILRGPAGVDYSCNVKFSFNVTEETYFDDVRRQIYVGLGLLPSQFKLNISARLNTGGIASFFYNLLGVDNDVIWKLVIQNATQLINFRMLEVVVESTPNIDNTSYDPNPNSIPGEPNSPPRNDYDLNVEPDTDNNPIGQEASDFRERERQDIEMDDGPDN